jgi:hypothetical protein
MSFLDGVKVHPDYVRQAQKVLAEMQAATKILKNQGKSTMKTTFVMFVEVEHDGALSAEEIGEDLNEWTEKFDVRGDDHPLDEVTVFGPSVITTNAPSELLAIHEQLAHLETTLQLVASTLATLVKETPSKK